MMSPRPDAYAAFLGVEVDSPGGGRAEARLRVEESHLNPPWHRARCTDLLPGRHRAGIGSQRQPALRGRQRCARRLPPTCRPGRRPRGRGRGCRTTGQGGRLRRPRHPGRRSRRQGNGPGHPPRTLTRVGFRFRQRHSVPRISATAGSHPIGGRVNPAVRWLCRPGCGLVRKRFSGSQAALSSRSRWSLVSPYPARTAEASVPGSKLR